MTLLIMILLLVGAAFFMAIPFFKADEAKTVSIADSDGERPALMLEKEAAYAAIKDLHFDYLTGKLSDEDYRLLQSKYESRAIELLKKIEKSDGGEAIEQEIEKKITEMRKYPTAAGVKESLDGATVTMALNRCAQCGASLKLGAKYCGECRVKLKTSCRGCGFEARPGDKFCSACGAKLN